jgi:hypothetical protein
MRAVPTTMILVPILTDSGIGEAISAWIQRFPPSA